MGIYISDIIIIFSKKGRFIVFLTYYQIYYKNVDKFFYPLQISDYTISDNSELTAMCLVNALLRSCWLWKYVILETIKSQIMLLNQKSLFN